LRLILDILRVMSVLCYLQRYGVFREMHIPGEMRLFGEMYLLRHFVGAAVEVTLEESRPPGGDSMPTVPKRDQALERIEQTPARPESAVCTNPVMLGLLLNTVRTLPL
jgi:hypothetical protein